MGNTLFNFSNYLRDHARKNPEKNAIIYSTGKTGHGKYGYLRYEELDKESDIIAHGLEKAGIIKGTKTVLMVKPGPDFYALVFGIFKVGAVPVLVDPGMGMKRMLHCLETTRAEAFIGISIAHIIRILSPKTFKSLKSWVTVGKRLFWSGPTLGEIKKEAWQPYEISDTTEDDLAAISFTTGSTGPAKGVEYSHRMFRAMISAVSSAFNMEHNKVDLVTFPVFALIDVSLGMTAVLPNIDPTKPARANPVEIVNVMEDHGVTTMFASPALLNRLVRHCVEQGIVIKTLRNAIAGGAPVHISLIHEFQKIVTDDAQLNVTYGATEGLPISTMSSKDILSETKKLSDKGAGSCIGKPVESLTVRIMKITDEPVEEYSDSILVPPGEIGEIIISGDLMSRRYYNKPEENRYAKIKDGDGFWHRMGDMGWMDEKGRLWFCGRKKHIVTSAAGMLFTVPVESIFNTHRDVFRSALVGIGPEGNQVPVVFIELEKGINMDKSLIMEELREIAAGNDITRSIERFIFHDSFPVDIRHNAKIFREKLALLAEKKTA